LQRKKCTLNQNKQIKTSTTNECFTTKQKNEHCKKIKLLIQEVKQIQNDNKAQQKQSTNGLKA
jgi:hypothetical protein